MSDYTMYKGATPTFTISLPHPAGESPEYVGQHVMAGFKTDTLTAFLLTFSEVNESGRVRTVFFERYGKFSDNEYQIRIEDGVAKFDVTLTESESLRLKAGKVTMQLKLVFMNKMVMVSTKDDFECLGSITDTEINKHA